MSEPKVEYRDPTCQNCGSHTNRPSVCNKHNKYVNRKAAVCKQYTGPEKVRKFIPEVIR
jgi:Fe-S-cluster containining protein